MGAWATGNFGNDDAMDFLYEASGNTAAVVRAEIEAFLSHPLGTYLQAPECSRVLVAAEFVAGAWSQPAQGFPEEETQHLVVVRPDEALLANAIACVDRVVKASELKELWQESEDFDAWTAHQTDLKNRLGQNRSE